MESNKSHAEGCCDTTESRTYLVSITMFVYVNCFRRNGGRGREGRMGSTGIFIESQPMVFPSTVLLGWRPRADWALEAPTGSRAWCGLLSNRSGRTEHLLAHLVPNLTKHHQ